MDIANLPTYGCFGGGEMYKLNKSADLSKVQQYVKLEDIKEASLNSPASPVQQLQAKIRASLDKLCNCSPVDLGKAIDNHVAEMRELSAMQ